MTDRCKHQVLLVSGVLACAVLFGGCNGGEAGSPAGDNTEVTSYADKRADLWRQLDRKFENSDVHFKLGESFRSDGLWTQARYHFDTALRFDPANRAAQAAMVRMLADCGEDAKAGALARRYIKSLDSSWEETLELGKAFRAEQVDAYALACYQQAVRLKPDSAEAHKAMGYYYLSKNNREIAKEHLKQSFRLDPMQVEVAGDLGRLGVEVRVPRESEDSS